MKIVVSKGSFSGILAPLQRWKFIEGGNFQVCVVEPDPSYSTSATTLSVGGLRSSLCQNYLYKWKKRYHHDLFQFRMFLETFTMNEHIQCQHTNQDIRNKIHLRQQFSLRENIKIGLYARYQPSLSNSSQIFSYSVSQTFSDFELLLHSLLKVWFMILLLDDIHVW